MNAGQQPRGSVGPGRSLSSHPSPSESAFLHLLIDQLRPSVRANPNALPNLLHHLARMVSGHVAVITAEGKAISAGDSIHSIPSEVYNSEPARRVRAGELGAASLIRDGIYIQILSIGESNPRPAIFVARKTEYPTWMANLVSRAAVTLAAVSSLSRVERAEHQLARVSQTARTSVLAQLMIGNPDTARRLAGSFIPGVLDTSLVRVFIIKCPPCTRARILEACQHCLADEALAAADLDRNDHVVVVAPTPMPPHVDDVRTVIKDLAASHAPCTVGESGPVELNHVGNAFEMALRALAVARRSPDHFAQYSEERQLAHILADSARTWAEAYLKPLHELSDGEKSQLFTVLQLVLQFGKIGAARKVGLNRKTVDTRWRRAESILGLDLHDMQVRAELNLALHLM